VVGWATDALEERADGDISYYDGIALGEDDELGDTLQRAEAVFAAVKEHQPITTDQVKLLPCVALGLGSRRHSVEAPQALRQKRSPPLLATEYQPLSQLSSRMRSQAGKSSPKTSGKVWSPSLFRFSSPRQGYSALAIWMRFCKSSGTAPWMPVTVPSSYRCAAMPYTMHCADSSLGMLPRYARGRQDTGCSIRHGHVGFDEVGRLHRDHHFLG
jgi:hypothetical protein